MSAKILCIAVFVIAVVGWSRAAQSQPAPPRPLPTRGVASSLLIERAEAAVEIESSTTSTQWLALAVASGAFMLAAVGLWWLSSRWLSYSMFHWLALVVIPALFAFAIVWWSRDSVQSRLDHLPAESLRHVLDDPVLGADQERVEAVRHTLSLKATADQGHLLRMLALRPTLSAVSGALVLIFVLWYLTNRRVLKST